MICSLKMNDKTSPIQLRLELIHLAIHPAKQQSILWYLRLIVQDPNEKPYRGHTRQIHLCF